MTPTTDSSTTSRMSQSSSSCLCPWVYVNKAHEPSNSLDNAYVNEPGATMLEFGAMKMIGQTMLFKKPQIKYITSRLIGGGQFKPSPLSHPVKTQSIPILKTLLSCIIQTARTGTEYPHSSHPAGTIPNQPIVSIVIPRDVQVYPLHFRRLSPLVASHSTTMWQRQELQ